MRAQYIKKEKVSQTVARIWIFALAYYRIRSDGVGRPAKRDTVERQRVPFLVFGLDRAGQYFSVSRELFLYL